MKPNGRRAWRKAAKKLRWKMGRRWRSQEEWVHGKRWSELVPDLEAHRAHITGTWFKRHGFQSFDAESSSRHYIGLWGSANGETIGFVESASSITDRSLVGMTQGARKRRAQEWMECERLHQRAQDLQEVVDRQMGRRSQPRTVGHTPRSLKQHYLIGQKLRPCPGCWNCQTTWQQSSIYSQTAVMHRHGCSHDDPSGLCCFGETVPVKMECDGSGVLPARKAKR